MLFVLHPSWPSKETWLKLPPILKIQVMVQALMKKSNRQSASSVSSPQVGASPYPFAAATACAGPPLASATASRAGTDLTARRLKVKP